MLITEKDKLSMFYSEKRIWQGIPGIQVCKNGYVYVCFYSGNTKEGTGNYCLLIRSTDNGQHFSEPIAVACPEDENSRYYDPCVWLDPYGRLWFFFSSMPMQKVFCVVCDDPCTNDPVFSEVRVIGDGVMLNKPTVTSDGKWYLSLSVWDPKLWTPFVLCNNITPGAFVYVSEDNGKTFIKKGGSFAENSSYDEHMVVEMKDKSLTMFLRAPYGIGRSRSYDGGSTWTKVEDSGLGGPDSRFSITRMPSGNILLVNHYNFTGRNNLYAMISDDEMKSFKGFLAIDTRNDVSYPDVSYGPDGYIYVVYDHERGGYCHSIGEVMSMQREILLAKIKEEDILSGSIVMPGSKLCMIVNKLGEYKGDIPAEFIGFGNNDDDIVNNLCAMSSQTDITDMLFDEYGNKCLNLSYIERRDLDLQINELCMCLSRIDIKEKRRRLRMIINILKAPILKKRLDDGRFMMERVFAYLSSCFCESFTLEQMSDSLSVSKYYLCHLFKSYTGDSIIQYRNTLRLRLARRLLTNTDMPLTEISGTCGFESVSYFTESFKKYEGITPSEYKKIYTKKGENQ